jgi:starch synthase
LPLRLFREAAVFVVMVASECAPVAQAGGLGQVIFGLSRELELRGHAVEIIMPKYDCIHYDQIFGLAVAYQDLQVPWYSGFVHCTVWFGWVHGRKCFFHRPALTGPVLQPGPLVRLA